MDPFRVDFPVPPVIDLEGSAADDGHLEPQAHADAEPEVDHAGAGGGA